MQISYIPQDIIYNHIIPYTYQPQPSTLLKDIVHYHNSLDFIIKHYLDVFSNTQSYKYTICRPGRLPTFPGDQAGANIA